jgi:formyl-CoA transferase
VLRHAPPALGQHTREVLAEFGIDAARFDTLRAAGVV